MLDRVKKPDNQRSGAIGPEALKPLSRDDVQKVAAAYVEECVDFRDAELQPSRIKIDRYYRGKVDLPEPEGRSKVIVTAVRDGVRSVVPSLARIFTQTDVVGEFYSNNEEDQQICKDATAYCNDVFWQHGGYRALIEASTDSLKAKVGVIKIDLENKIFTSHINYETAALAEQGIELDNITEANDDTTIQLKISKRKVWSFTPVPPEEFIIHPSAKTIESACACAHEREESISNLIAMGFKYEDLKDIPSSTPINTESEERKQSFREKREGTSPEVDPTARFILFAEAYVRIDADGDGIAELRKVCLAGEGRKVLSDEPINWSPFAEFVAEIAPHVFYPICLAEDLVQDQDVQTALLRSIVDNAALTNNPRTEVNERMVNLDDAKNGRIGAMIRVREMGQINELATPFVAGQTLVVLQHLQEVQERRSGITKLSQGLDPEALQSASRIAAQAAVSAADARIEMMARNIAETGVKSLFKCILRTAIYNIREAQSIQTPEGFKNVNPSMWHQYMSIKCNVGLGSGRIDEKKMALTGLIPIQQQILQMLGPGNPVCNWNNIRETLKTLLRLNGIRDYQTYFPYVPPEKLAEIDKQMQASNQENQKKQQEAQQAQNGAMLELVKVEAQKSQLKYQTDMADMKRKYETDIAELKTKMADMASKLKIEATKVILQDDRERDKADMTFAIDVAKVGLGEDQVKATEAKVAATRSSGGLQ